MGIKFGSVILVILGIFIAKISLENFNQAQASASNPQERHPSTSRIHD